MSQAKQGFIPCKEVSLGFQQRNSSPDYSGEKKWCWQDEARDKREAGAVPQAWAMMWEKGLPYGLKTVSGDSW